MIHRAVSETTSATETVAAPDLEDSALYYNRELSWVQFNERVLELAEDASVPLLERVKFCAIYSSNLDEFFMVRVAGLHDQIEAGIEKPLQDGRTPSESERLEMYGNGRPRPTASGVRTGKICRRKRSSRLLRSVRLTSA